MHTTKYMKTFFLFSILLFLPLTLIDAQVLQDYYRYNETTLDHANVLQLEINSSVFFNNKEFFGVGTEGYTLTGAYFQPRLRYSITKQLSMAAGVHLLKYYGRNEFSQILPVFSIDYRPNEKFTLIAGSFNGGESFGLPEAMYMFENQFTHLLNNGILMNYSSGNISSKIWLNWEKLIFPADTIQEMFTFGSSNRIGLIKNKQISLDIPLWLLAHHKGGQINNSNEKVVTKLDLGTGLELRKKLDNNFFKELVLNPLVFIDLDENDNEQGFAVQPQAGFRNDYLEVSLGAFYGKQYQSYWGNPILFSPLVRQEPFVNDTNRLDLLFKAGFGKKFGSGSFLQLQFKGYYDTKIGKFQYFYGLQMVAKVMR